VTIGVPFSDISSHEPAVFSECLFCLLLEIEIAFGDTCSTDPYFSLRRVTLSKVTSVSEINKFGLNGSWKNSENIGIPNEGILDCATTGIELVINPPTC
jgi:hypothetical protein